MLKHFLLLPGLALLLCPALADDLQLNDFDYPYEMHTLRIFSQQQELDMAYAEVQPKGKKELGTVVLLHGKNFGGFYWKETATALSEAGYRVLILDQIGFGKSDKPKNYQYSFQQLAENTNTLLLRLNHRKFHLVGHSMGGMLAVRFALMFPSEVESLILVNPLGLEDWKTKGVPYRAVDNLYQQELKQTREDLIAYQTENYFDGSWRDNYLRSIQMFDSLKKSPNYPRMAWNQALTSDMIYTQPVCYEFRNLEVPTLLLIGQRDRTAPGSDRAPEDVQDSLGNYPELGRQAADIIPRSKLVELEDIGHVPQLEAFPQFIEPLIKYLKKPVWDKKEKPKEKKEE